MAFHNLDILNENTWTKKEFTTAEKSQYAVEIDAEASIDIEYAANYYTAPFYNFPYRAVIRTSEPTRLAMWFEPDREYIYILSTKPCSVSITSADGLDNGFSAIFNFGNNVRRPASTKELLGGTFSIDVQTENIYQDASLYSTQNRVYFSFSSINNSMIVDDEWTGAIAISLIRNYNFEIPVFTSYENAADYLINGNINGAYNVGNSESGIVSNITYFLRQYVKKNETTLDLLTKEHNIINIHNDARIALYYSEHPAGGIGEPNMHLIISQMPAKFDGIEVLVLTEALSNYYYGDWQDFETGDYYNVSIDTNILKFANQKDAGDYVTGFTDGSKAINYSEVQTKNYTGSGIDSTELDMHSYDSNLGGTSAWLLTSSNMLEFKNHIFNDSNKDALLNGLWLYGDEPFAAVQNIYWLPFDASLFYTMGTEAPVQLGTHTIDDVDGFKFVKGGKKLTLINTLIKGTYGDFRDYEDFKYELKLPYMGMVTLNPQKYINKKIKCEMLFDVMTHTIRYCLFANNLLIDTFDCNVGVDMPLYASNMASKSADFVNSLINIPAQVAGSVAGTASRMAVGNTAQAVSSGINGVSSMLEGITSMIKEPSHTLAGSYSSNISIYDVRYPFLIITEYETLKPANLNQIFNYPSFYIGKLSSCSGYVEASDIRLTSRATEAEQNEIKNIIASGIII